MSAAQDTSRRDQLAPRTRREIAGRSDLILSAVVPVEQNGGRTDTRKRVLESAIGLFGRKGFEACTMKDLAAAAQVKPPALYNHFESKEQILAEATRNALGVFLRSVLGPLEDEPSAGWLESIVRRHTLFHIEQSDLAFANDTILYGDRKISYLPEDDARSIRELEAGYVEIIRELIRARTGMRSRPRLTATTFAVLAVCDRVSTWYRADGALRPDQLAAINWQLVAGMLDG
jgi:TetR/AcrR family transcriptional regulator, cholesterol catabolism regulator